MNRFLDAESNGGIFIDIACSEPNILTCKVIGSKRNIIMRPVSNYRHATIYISDIFSKHRRFYLYFKPVTFKTGLYKEIFMGISMV